MAPLRSLPNNGRSCRPGTWARAALRKRLPTAVELVYDNYQFLAIGLGATERASDCVRSLAVSPNGVALSYYYVAALAHAATPLPTTGARVHGHRVDLGHPTAASGGTPPEVTMRGWTLMFTLLVVAGACGRTDASRSEAVAASPIPRRPRAFVGAWRRIAPTRLRGDTLRLSADSSAEGIVPWPPNRLARISRWRIRFGSKDPAATRADWRQGYSDGGDAECVLQDNPSCTSMPLLCLGAATEVICSPFVVTADSLMLADGQRFVRLTAEDATTKDIP